jgi:predicted nucleic acid-binding protein
VLGCSWIRASWSLTWREEIPTAIVDWTGPELPRLWERTLDLLEESDGRLSFHDCLLVLVSREGNIEWLASFDRSFDQVRGLKRIGALSSVTP